MRVNPALVEDRKNSGFFENQEKDVWHALLSFQGTGSPRLDPRGRRRPTGVYSRPDFRQKTERAVYVILPALSTI